MIKKIVLAYALLFGFGVAWAGDSAPRPTAIKVKVGLSGAPVAAPTGRVVRGATATGGTLTVTWTQVMQLGDGTMQWVITYTNAGGQVIHIRQLTLDPACTKVIDQYSNLVYTTTGPTDALCTTQAALLARTNTMISNAATGGKLAL